MIENVEEPFNADEVHAAARKAVEANVNVAQEVRDITINALTQGRLEPERIKAVIEAVVEGASRGAETHGKKVREVLGEAITGLDHALGHAAEASKLAIEEAAGRMGDFSEQELRRAMDDLKSLETMYVDTLADIAKSTGDRVGEVLTGLVEHTRHSGSDVGTRVLKELTGLQQQLQAQGLAGLRASTEAARSTGARIAQIASGVLAGIASSLQPRPTAKAEKHTGDESG